MLDLKPRTFGTSSHDPDVGPLGLRPSTPSSPSDLRRWTLNLGLRIFGTSSHDPDVGPRDFVPRPETFGTSSHDPDVGPLGLRPRLERQVLQTSGVGLTSDLWDFVSRPGCRTFGAPPLDSNVRVLQTSDVRPGPDFGPSGLRLTTRMSDLWGSAPRLERQVLQTSALDLEPRTSDLRDFVSRPGCRTFGAPPDSNVKFFRPRRGPRTSEFRTFGTSSHDPDVGPLGLRPSTRASSPSDLRRWTSNLGLRTFGTSSHDPDVGPLGLRPSTRSVKSFRPQALDLEPRTSDLRDFVSRPGCRTLGLRPSTRTSSPSDLRRWTSNLGLRICGTSSHDPDADLRDLSRRPDLRDFRLTTRMSDLRGSAPRLASSSSDLSVGPRTSDFRTFGTSSHDPDVGPLGLRPSTRASSPSDPQALDLEPRTSDLRDFVSRPGCLRPFGLVPRPGPSGLRLTTRMSDLRGSAPRLERQVLRPQALDLEPRTSDLRDFVSRPGCRDLRDFVPRPGPSGLRRHTTRMSDLWGSAPRLERQSFRPRALDLEPRTSDLRDFISRPGHWTSGLCPTTRTFHMIVVTSRTLLHRHTDTDDARPAEKHPRKALRISADANTDILLKQGWRRRKNLLSKVWFFSPTQTHVSLWPDPPLPLLDCPCPCAAFSDARATRHLPDMSASRLRVPRLPTRRCLPRVVARVAREDGEARRRGVVWPRLPEATRASSSTSIVPSGVAAATWYLSCKRLRIVPAS